METPKSPLFALVEKDPLAFGMGALLLLVVFYVRVLSPYSLVDAYYESQIHARINRVGVDHGEILVSPRGNSVLNSRVLYAPSACKSYVRTNDSVAKEAGSRYLTVFRDSGRWRVSTTWDYEAATNPVERRHWPKQAQ
jgi:hypothetical protein